MHLFADALPILDIGAEVVRLSILFKSLLKVRLIILDSTTGWVMVLLDPFNLLLNGPFSIYLKHIMLLVLR